MTRETLRLVAEEDWSEESCPECHYDFNTHDWEEISHGGDHWGGSAIYRCPVCEDGTASVIY